MFKSSHRFFDIESKRGTIKALDFCAKGTERKIYVPNKGKWLLTVFNVCACSSNTS